jgi:hypothetical protein
LQARNHVDVMEALDLVDFDAAGAVSGAKFYYLRHAAALLEMALVNLALQVRTSGSTSRPLSDCCLQVLCSLLSKNVVWISAHAT